mmetsp:Transcript_22303/g.63801  ORF Transcript_22303/g.63801 Transcript_22303/m.63801 type:complete len:230 (-) Transcript_22303:1223-1912(-)
MLAHDRLVHSGLALARLCVPMAPRRFLGGGRAVATHGAQHRHAHVVVVCCAPRAGGFGLCLPAGARERVAGGEQASARGAAREPKPPQETTALGAALVGGVADSAALGGCYQVPSARLLGAREAPHRGLPRGRPAARPERPLDAFRPSRGRAHLAPAAGPRGRGRGAGRALPLALGGLGCGCCGAPRPSHGAQEIDDHNRRHRGDMSHRRGVYLGRSEAHLLGRAPAGS